jgi:hypothetical protein
MYRALFFGLALGAGLSWAGAPMDLDSPFLKIALVKGSTGAVEEREVTKVKIVGDKIELLSSKGSVALIAQADVTALIPKLPEAGMVYKLEDVDRAVQMLESLPEGLKQRPEASAGTLQKWKDLRKPAEEAEAKGRANEKKAEEERFKLENEKFNEWIAEATDFQRPRSEEDLTQLRKRGEQFLEGKVGDEIQVRDGLALLSQVVAKEKGGPLPDLAKLNEIQPRLLPDDLLVWVVVGILILSFFGLLLGLSFSSNGLTRLWEGAFFGGIVFLGVGLAVLSALAALWWPVGGEGEPVSIAVTPEMEKINLYAKNSIKPVYFLPRTEFRVMGKDFVAGIRAALPPSDEPVGMFKGKLKEGKLWIDQARFIWKQPLTALGIPLPVSFVFSGKIPTPESWKEITADRVALGKIVIPDVLGASFCESMSATVQSGLSAAGLAGAKLRGEDGMKLSLSMPSSGTRPVLTTTTTTTTTSAYRREINAEDLAKFFVEDKGAEFSGKFVVVEGVVEKIFSGSEISGGGIATAGDSLNKGKPDVKISGDRFDIFFLKGLNSYGFRKDPLYIKVLIKSPSVYVMDSYGDVYRGPNANIVKEKAFIKKGYRVKFLKEGRVQGDTIKNNEIEVYGVEIDGDADIQCTDPNAPAPN